MGYSTWASQREDEAVLLFEVKGKAEQTRSGEDAATWSRVYQLNDYFLDLSCLYRNHKAELVGQLTARQRFELDRPAQLRLVDTRHQVQDMNLDSWGHFRFELLPGQDYALEVAIEHQPKAMVSIPNPVS